MIKVGTKLNQRYRVLRQLGEGGFGRLFEVSDRGKIKVLKVLQLDKFTNSDDRETALSLFRREAEVLSQLNCDRIPKVRPDEKHFLVEDDSGETFHCFVMEKIEGVSLEAWVKQNGCISLPMAIAWLKQLTEIIGYLHERNYFHRDIKPVNIIVDRKGKLFLIDFGSVRKISSTYIVKETARSVTKIVSSGYAPAEQIRGRAVPQSDFFALGRTMVYLLTGIFPDCLPENDDWELVWRDLVPDLDDNLADLIDWLMASLPVNRPQTAEQILQKIDNILGFSPSQRLQLPPLNRLGVLFASTLIAAMVMGVRWTGILQPIELLAYDFMMRSRLPEPMDENIFVVEITQDDLNKYNSGGNLIDDITLAKAIKAVEAHQPNAIGVAIHRGEERWDGREELMSAFQNEAIFGLCSYTSEKPDFEPPSQFSSEQIRNQLGFSEFLSKDGEAVIRKQLLSYNSDSVSTFCKTSHSFSLKLAYQFLSNNGISFFKLVPPNNEWKIGRVRFQKAFPRHRGFHLSKEAMPNAILLNYRANLQPAPSIDLQTLLEPGISPDSIAGKIVLIGYAPGVTGKLFKTPYGEMSSLWIYVHQTSQLIGAVLDNRPGGVTSRAVS